MKVLADCLPTALSPRPQYRPALISEPPRTRPVRLESGGQIKARSVVVARSLVFNTFILLIAARRRDSMSLERHQEPATDVDSQQRYNKLPAELWNMVIDLACLGRPPSSPNSSGSFFQRDVPTMLSLNLVCLEMHDYVQPIIYQKIAITRPSALYALHQVLQAHPERARLVEEIHVGPQEILPPYWWPLSVLDAPKPRLAPRRYARLDFGISSHPRRLLSSSLDQSSLPFGCETRQAWSLDRSESSCREEAVHDALEQAQISLGVDLLREKVLGIERLYEVQAALDLYLAHVKSVEEQRPELILMARPGAQVPPRTTVSDIYSRLALTDVPASIPSLWLDLNPQSFRPAEAYDGMFVVSYLQLLCHLARPGAITDRFDHPLLFGRSGFDTHLSEPERDNSRLEEPPQVCSSGYGYQLHHGTWHVEGEPDTFYWPQLPFLRAIVNNATTTQDERPLVARVVHTGTVSSILRLARGVLASTTGVKTVSLTGFLQHAVGTQRLPSLRRLSLGPSPPCWKADPALQGLDQVEELRICGVSLERDQTWYITSKMKRLRTLEWSLRERASEVSFP